MLDLTKSLICAVALCLGTAVGAQETPAPAEPAPTATVETPAEPAADAPAAAGDPPLPGSLSLGEEVGGIGSTYVQETHGDWELRCIRTEDGADPCQLYQLLKDSQGNSVAEISMFALPEGQEAAAGASIITPLETLLTQQITLTIDAGTPKRYPFTWCAPIGCVARVGFTTAEVDQLKKGAKATLTIVPVAAPDQKVDLDVSLKGFTAGFAAVAKVNAGQTPPG